jgi:hypothetical protein
MVIYSTDIDTTINRRVIVGLETLLEKEVRRMKVHFWLIGSLEYFQGESHV